MTLTWQYCFIHAVFLLRFKPDLFISVSVLDEETKERYVDKIKYSKMIVDLSGGTVPGHVLVHVVDKMWAEAIDRSTTYGKVDRREFAMSLSLFDVQSLMKIEY